ncbi:MAG TPA: hypothetical protein VMG99_02150 [Thermoplasmata archaeon]|nr:hypothetical protein [Thermoplasmata archaeon]
MSGPAAGAPPSVGHRSRIGEYVPLPLVAVAMLLVGLLVLTPLLLSSGGPPAAGTVLTQADLIVDRVAGENVTHFYVRAVGLTVRYASIEVTSASGFAWTGTSPPSWDSLAWGPAVNATNVLSASFATSDNPIALNVTVLYNANGVAYYVGTFSFYATNTTAPANTLYGLSPTSGVTVPYQNGLASLPLAIPLADVGSGGP